MMELTIAAVAGLLLGSFLNVCIHRMPRDESIVWPGSRCPACGHAVAPYDNIPVLSYLLLNARCRQCRTAISWRYPFVELSACGLCVAAAITWGPTPLAAKSAVFTLLCLGMTFADLETRLLPDQFTLGGAALGVAFAILVPVENSLLALYLPSAPRMLLSAATAALAAGFLAGVLWVIGETYRRLRHREGLGLGDVKMAAMLAAFLGVPHALLAIFLGSFGGTLIGLLYIRLARQKAATYELPFGSFLGVAGIVTAYWLR